MGAQSLQGMLDGALSMPKAEIVRWHLLYNHYPALNAALTDSCVRAVEKAARGHWEARVLLPVGYRTTRDNRRTIPVAELVELCHLDDLVDQRRGELGYEDWE